LAKVVPRPERAGIRVIARTALHRPDSGSLAGNADQRPDEPDDRGAISIP